MKVLVADKFEKVGVDGLKELGCEVVLRPDVKAEDLPATVTEVRPEILIVRGKKVSEASLEAGPSLSLVIRAGAGIDLAYGQAVGVGVPRDFEDLRDDDTGAGQEIDNLPL